MNLVLKIQEFTGLEKIGAGVIGFGGET